MQEDTFLGNWGDPLSLNLYVYCRNNPLIYIDRSGHAATGLNSDYSNAVWNRYGEIIGYNPNGGSYTDKSNAATNTYGGGAQAQQAWYGSSGSSDYSGNGSSSSTNNTIAIDYAQAASELGLVQTGAWKDSVDQALRNMGVTANIISGSNTSGPLYSMPPAVTIYTGYTIAFATQNNLFIPLSAKNSSFLLKGSLSSKLAESIGKGYRPKPTVLGKVYPTSDGGYIRILNEVGYEVLSSDLERMDRLAFDYRIQGKLTVTGTPTENLYVTSDGNYVRIAENGIAYVVREYEGDRFNDKQNEYNGNKNPTSIGVPASGYPAYSDLTEADRAAYNTQIFQDRPSSLWPLEGDEWKNKMDWPTYQSGNLHGGVDIDAPFGTAIKSIYYGIAYTKTQTNTDTNEIAGGGNYVYVVSDINGESVTLSYMHMSKWAVDSGQEVTPGDLLGFVGDTGSPKAGDYHLHFQKNFVKPKPGDDPRSYLPQEPLK